MSNAAHQHAFLLRDYDRIFNLKLLTADIDCIFGV